MRIRTLVTAGALALTSLVAAPAAHAAYCEKTFIGPEGDRLLLYVCFDDTLDNYAVHVSSTIEALVIGGVSVAQNTDEAGSVSHTVCVDYFRNGTRERVCQTVPI